jgi:microcystin-dependent protein
MAFTDKYDLEEIAYGTTGWNTILTTNLGKIDDAMQTYFEATAGEAISQYDAVYLESDGKVYQALDDATPQWPCLGIAIEAAAADATIRIQRVGVMTNAGWSWTVGAKIYLDGSTPGALSESESTNTVQVVAIAISATKILILGGLSLSGVTDADAIHDNVAGEIAAVTEKATPVSADLLLIEDSADSNNKKRLQVGNIDHDILSGLTDDDHTIYTLADGSRDFSAKVSYSSHPTFSADTEIVDKKYVDDNAVATPVGAVMDYAGSSAPSGWLLCYGQAVSRTTYADLFAAIGTTYGVGDGSTTFNVPDLRGRVTAGKDDMGGTGANRLTSGSAAALDGTTLGAAGGDEEHQLTESELAAHNHGPGDHTYFVEMNVTGSSAVNAGSGSVTSYSSTTTGDTGGDSAHNNVQPTLILNKIIKH